MGAFLAANGGTILVVLTLAVIVFFIIRSMRKNKKMGKSSCGCNCAHCAAAGTCHSVAKPKKAA